MKPSSALVRRILAEKSVLTLLITSFFSSLSGFLVAPFIAVYLVQNGNLSLQAAGLYMGFSYWCLTAGSLIGGPLADKYGHKRVMLAGIGMRAPGYLLFLGSSNQLILLAACFITGIGGALYFPTSKAALLSVSPKDLRLKIFAVRNMCANFGVALGPLAGALLLRISAAALFVAAATTFMLLFLANLRLRLPPGKSSASSVFRDMRKSLGERSVWVVCTVSVLFGFVYINFESTLPMFLGNVGEKQWLPWVFVVNAAVVLLAQFPATWMLERWSLRLNSAIGFLLYAAGLAFFAGPSSYLVLWVVGIIAFSCGEVVVSLLIDARIAMSEYENPAGVFGISGFANAIGGLIGGWYGAQLIALSPGSTSGGQSFFPWLALGATTALCALVAAVVMSSNNPTDANSNTKGQPS